MHQTFPRIRPPTQGGPAPEVVFRTLHRLQVPFAMPVARTFKDVTPNAIHYAAANLLGRGGAVWTTNFDLGVERASEAVPAVAVGRPPSAGDYRSLLESEPGVLVKFHGTAAVPETMAFTDWELLTPLAEGAVEHFARLAKGAHLVLYGYRGADPDLADMLDAVMAAASEVTWLVAERDAVADVIAAFPGARIRFRPEVGDTPDFDACARTFLEVVEPYGVLDPMPEGVIHELFEHRDTARVEFGVRSDTVPQIVHADLVERFGMPDDRHAAFRRAFLLDLRSPVQPVQVWRRYLRQAAASSLYDGWFLSSIIHASVVLSRYRVIQHLAGLPLVRRYRNVVLDKGPALLLRRGRWAEMQRLTEHGIAVRDTASGPTPTDLYYHGHALRYQGAFRAARQDQAEAERGLTGSDGSTVDPERLAGAILEQGILDLYAGHFDDAAHRGWDLRERRGRFAIRRWRAWGQWLSGTAAVYQLDLKVASDQLCAAATYFLSVNEWSHLADVRSAQLLLARVQKAAGVPVVLPDPVDGQYLSPRQHDDLRLVRADLALADGDADRARTLAEHVAGAPSNVPAAMWSELILAEFDRRDGRGTERLRALADDARAAGASWLELQALRSMARDGDPVSSEVAALQASMQLPDYDGLREPPPIWSLT